VSDDHLIDFIMFTGYGQSEIHPDHGPLTRRLSAIGYVPVYQPITWFGPPPDLTPTLWPDWLEQSRPICASPVAGRRRIYAGFSVGALVAFAMAAMYPPDELWLLSPSVWAPDAADIPGVSEMIERSQIAPEVLHSMAGVSVKALAGGKTCPVRVAVGRQDVEPMQGWATRVADLTAARQYCRIRGAGHNLFHHAYLEVVVSQMTTNKQSR
jgi:pimeloyl-ACP methyl ester carboxylesterase